MVIINESAEKFRDKQNEICGFLFDLLRQLNALETEIYDRKRELDQKKTELGIPKSQIAPGEKELWAEYKSRLGELLKPVCTEKLLKCGYGGSYGKPTHYGYIDGECKVNFIMKTANRAVIKTHFSAGINQKQKFVIKNVDGKWLIDEVYYGFENEDTWNADTIM